MEAIKAQDLRLDNLVEFHYAGTKAIHAVAGINSDNTIRLWMDAEKTEQIGCFRTNFIAPVVLTEELLLRCGFEKRDNHGWFNFKYFTDCEEAAETMLICYNLKSGRLSISDADEEDAAPVYTAKSIKVLHIFQNAFYYLTGTELPYSETA